MDVFLSGTLVGSLKIDGVSSVFKYDENYHGDPISLSIPLGESQFSEEFHQGKTYVPPFFENLLPQGENLKEILRHEQSLSGDQWGLLSKVAGLGGIDISKPFNDKINIVDLDEVDTFSLDQSLPASFINADFSLDTPIKISIAGMQKKRLVVLEETGIVRMPKEGEAWTHILKIPNLMNKSLADNEHLMMKSIKQAGLSTGKTTSFDYGELSYFLTERFDVANGNRVLQEELLSALGKGSDDMFTHGYDTLSKGIRKIGLSKKCIKGIVSQITISAFLKNGDLHEKNISIQLINGKYQLSPIYDVLNTSVMGDTTMALPIEEGYSSAWSVEQLPLIYKTFGLGKSELRSDLNIVTKILRNIENNIDIIKDQDVKAGILSSLESSNVSLKKMLHGKPPII